MTAFIIEDHGKTKPTTTVLEGETLQQTQLMLFAVLKIKAKAVRR